MKIKWAVAGLALGGIFAAFGTGVGVGVISAGPALIKAHCFVAEPRGITWAVHKAGICDGMVDASRDIHIRDQGPGSRPTVGLDPSGTP
jgi:hypothetical protein